MKRVVAPRRPFTLGLAAAVLATAAAVGCGGTPSSPARLGDGSDPASYGFDLGTLSGDPGLVASGMGRDQLPTLVDPPHFSGAEVARRNEEARGKVLVSSDRVVGLVLGGEARAWPLRLLRWHEVVNDTVGGVPVLIAYSPLCDAVVAAERTLGDEVLVLGSSGLLLDSNPLLFDRRLEPSGSSLWRQLSGEAVAGPLAGGRLTLLAPAVIPWVDWLAAHPDTTLLEPDPAMKRAYKRDPYHSYFGSDLLHFPVEPLPPQGDGAPHLKERVVVLEAAGERAALTLAELALRAGARSGAVRLTLGERELRLRFAVDQGAVWLEPAGVGDGELSLRTSFWFAWHALEADRTGRP